MSGSAQSPDGLLLACHGDDFTGSTAAMAALAAAGVSTTPIPPTDAYP